MAEDVETTDLTVEDILDQADAPKYHSILEVWRAILLPAEAERNRRVTPQWANRICSTYREFSFADMPAFRDRYFDKLAELRMILELEIATDDESLNVTAPEEDVEHNAGHYLNVLIDWQKAFLSWELDWDCTDDAAAVELAAISEVHRMIFDQTGLTSLLDNIKFEFTDQHRDFLADTLQQLRDSQEGR